jgi:hypothetical protein
MMRSKTSHARILKGLITDPRTTLRDFSTAKRIKTYLVVVAGASSLTLMLAGI